MTSEVVVMNRMAVALAADSAVTVEVGDTSKVRDSALKLFTLSKYRPVGVMVYNNSSILGVPLETIIKLFRSELGTKAFDTLPEYGEALISYLDGNASLFPVDVQERYFLRALETEYRRIRYLVRTELEDRGYYGGETDWADRVIAERLEFWRGLNDSGCFDDESAQKVMTRNSAGISEVVHRVFAGLPVGVEGVRHLQEIAGHLVCKDHFPPDVLSGLVIAGFGEGEHFPVVQHIEIGGVYADKLKVRPYSVASVSEENPSDVIAFGYQDMVDAFLNGISASIFTHLDDAAAFIEELPVLALDAVTGLTAEDREKLAENVRQASVRKATEFARNVVRGSRARRQEIASAVEALTIKELAQVASTLVGLSSFEQQMSLNRETVGGPVDVAVISKGDGLIWIERKHYFRKELNSHFFRNYYNEGVKKSYDKVRDDEEVVQDDQ